MMKKYKVLIATYYWPPSGGSGVQRFLKFCKYLPRFGIQPTVLTVANPTYPIVDESLKEEVPSDIDIFRTKTIEPFRLYASITGNDTLIASKPTQALKSDNWKTRVATWIRANIFIPDARIGWLMTAKRKALNLWNREEFEAIITTGPPHSTHFIGKYLIKKSNIRWIADFRDPWSKIYYNQLLPRTSIVKKIDRRMELSVLKRADRVVVVSPSMKKIQKEIYNRTYDVISNGFDPDDFGTRDDLHSYENKQFTIRFVGSVREAAIPTAIFKALSQIPQTKEISLEFIGNVHPKVRHLIGEYSIENRVSIKPYIPHKEAIKAMQSADLLLLSISKTKNSELILTGKLFDYLGAQTPILFVGTTKGDAAHIIQETGQGICFEHGDISGIRSFLEQVVENPDKLTNINQQIKRKDHKYSRVTLTSKLARLIKNS